MSEGRPETFRVHRPADFAPPLGKLVVLRDGVETLAMGGIAPLSAGVAELLGMWTAPAHRRRGHARRVLVELETAAAGLGYRAVRALVNGSDPALGMHLAAGYREVGTFNADGAPVVIFEKKLGPGRRRYEAAGPGSPASAPASSARPARSSLR
jgi:GNAT superfamily N-acetyltransferase